MNLIDTLNLWDTNLFLSMNGFHTPFLDGVMWAVSEKMSWIPLYIAVLYVIIKHWKREATWVVLALVLCVVIADQVSSGLIKDLVQRPRPSHAENLKGMVHLVNGYAGGRFGFVSSHAANAFGFALLSSLIFRRRTYSLFIILWALLTAYSRIYLGVHYPLDILGGAIVGVFAALVCFWALFKFRPALIFLDDDTHLKRPITYIPLIVLFLSIVAIIVYSIWSF